MEPINQEPVADRRPYEPPAVIYETGLEVRAGTPVGLPDPLDLTGSGPK